MKFEEQLKQDCKEIKEITHYLDKSYLKVQMESIHNGPISRIPPEIYVSQLDGLFNDFDSVASEDSIPLGWNSKKPKV